MFEKKIGIDLGTSSILIYMKGRGIVLQEPSIVAISQNEDRIVAIGEEALAMLGRVPEAIEITRPLRDGVIADYYVTERMLDFYIERLVGRFRLFPPEVMISTPVGITSVERRAVEDAARKAARKPAYTIPEPLAAAIGAGMPIDTPTANMVVDIGGGTSEAAVIAMNGIVTSDSIRTAGMKLDEAIINYVRRKYNLVIGEQTAEEVKIRIGSATPLEEPLEMETVYLGQQDINPCRGCRVCFDQGEEICPLKDDLISERELLPLPIETQLSGAIEPIFPCLANL